MCGERSCVNDLNKAKVDIVCCRSQAKAINKVLDMLTSEEVAIYKRGRNAKTSCVPKNASVSEYHAATGLEALFGYIYLKDDIKRLRELFDLIINA